MKVMRKVGDCCGGGVVVPCVGVGVGLSCFFMAAARSWAALATRPAVVRVLNLGLGGGLTGMVAEKMRTFSGVECCC